MKNSTSLLHSARRAFFARYGYLFFTFLAPALIMSVSYFTFGAYPFGDESVLVLDLNAQYVYFFGALRRALHGDASLIYSFSRALGGEFLGIFAYYLSSPLSWIVAIFPEKMMLDALFVMFVTKCGICGLTLAYYLDCHKVGNKQSRIVFGILYALCGYGVIYQHNTMWIDCMYLLPLVALGIERLVSKRKYLLFTLSLALAVFSNFYIGFMMCIFCFIYFFYAHFCVCNNDCGEKKHFLKSFVRMGVFSAIAIGLAACIILPAYYSLGFGKSDFSDPTFKFELRFDFLDYISRLFLNAYDTVRPEGLPIIYCGTLTLILLPLFFLAKRVPTRQKVGSGVMILVFSFSFMIDAVDKFWHGMQAPTWLNYRYSFMLVFFLVVMAANAFAEIRRIPASHICGSVCGWLITLFLCQKTVEFYEEKIVIDRDLLCFSVSLIFILIYAAALPLFKHKYYRHVAGAVLLVLVSAEMIVSGVSSICYLDDDVVYSTRSSYLDNVGKYEDSVDYILENDDGFYRFDKTKHSLINTPMTLGIRGFTNSTSTLNKSTIDFLRYMGISSKSHWSKYYGATAPFDSFLGVKYIITDGHYDVPTGYVHKFESKTTNVYENPYALSVAYAVNEGIKDLTLAYPEDYKEMLENGEIEKLDAFYTPPARMNALLGEMLGIDNTPKMFVAINDVDTDEANLNYSYVAEHALYKPIKSDSDAALYYSFSAKEDGIVYMYIPSDYPREADVKVNGEYNGTVMANETNRMISLGYFSKGEEIDVSLTLKNDRIYIRADEPLFWYVDYDVYSSGFESLKQNQFIIDEWCESRFEGKITLTDERSTVFTSIPYDENWKVFVDGNKTEIYEVLDALIAFDAAPGEHNVVIKYVPKQLYTGIAISVCSAVLLFAIFYCERRLKSRKNFEVEIIEEAKEEE
ncbi:MAG: YfhO family protein [Clostridia bacterium]|nr:YfhO family protein [Clostridia bacterium]